MPPSLKLPPPSPPLLPPHLQRPLPPPARFGAAVRLQGREEGAGGRRGDKVGGGDGQQVGAGRQEAGRLQARRQAGAGGRATASVNMGGQGDAVYPER